MISKKSQERIAGFSLVEIAIALAIFVFVITVVLGLLPVSLQTNKASADESRVVNIISQIVSDLKVPAVTAKTPIFNLPSLSSLPVGVTTYPVFYVDDAYRRVPLGSARYSVSLRFNRPALDSGQSVGIGISVAWPPGAKTALPTNQVETYLCVDPL